MTDEGREGRGETKKMAAERFLSDYAETASHQKNTSRIQLQ